VETPIEQFDAVGVAGRTGVDGDCLVFISLHPVPPAGLRAASAHTAGILYYVHPSPGHLEHSHGLLEPSGPICLDRGERSPKEYSAAPAFIGPSLIGRRQEGNPLRAREMATVNRG
jgi:hypothetical protein